MGGRCTGVDGLTLNTGTQREEHLRLKGQATEALGTGGGSSSAQGKQGAELEPAGGTRCPEGSGLSETPAVGRGSSAGAMTGFPGGAHSGPAEQLDSVSTETGPTTLIPAHSPRSRLSPYRVEACAGGLLTSGLLPGRVGLRFLQGRPGLPGPPPDWEPLHVGRGPCLRAAPALSAWGP